MGLVDAVVANSIDVDDVGVGIDIQLLLLGRGLDGVLGLEDLVKLLKLQEVLAIAHKRIQSIVGGLTVRFLVSGRRRKRTPNWTKHQTQKTM